MKPAISFLGAAAFLGTVALRGAAALSGAAACLALSLGLATAQESAPPEPASDQQLVRIRARMADNLRRLPNYTCLMTVDRSYRPPGRVRDLTRQDTIRLEVAEVGEKELFAWPGGTLVEQRLEDLVPNGMFANGDFAGLANIIFRTPDPTFRPAGKKKIAGHQAVGYSYQVTRAKSRYGLGHDGQTEIVPFHGIFWADPESLEILRVELELDGIPDSFGVRSSITNIDYQKLRIGASDFLLPSRVNRTMHYSAVGAMSENVSTFTNCHQYETQTVVRFDEPTDTAPAAAPLNPTEIHLPSGVRLPLKLETVMDAKKSAIGDPLVARLTEDVHVGNQVLPAGSEVRGRLHGLHWNPTGPCKIELAFTELRTPNALVTFQGFVESVEKHKGVSFGNVFKADELQVDPKYFNLAGLVFTYRTMADEK